MTALDRDLRYALAPLSTRAVYALLFAARREIADVLSLGHEPARVAARVLGVDRDEAAAELERLRAAGLVGDGLTLLAGVRRARSTSTGTPESSPADLDAVRAALVAYTGSRRALARELGCSESALRQFASGGRALGAGHVASLMATLGLRSPECAAEVRSNGCAVEVRSTHATAHAELRSGTAQGFSPSDSLSSSDSSSLSSPAFSQTKENEDSERTGGSLRECAQSDVRSDREATAQPPAAATAQTAPPALDAQPAKRRRERRPKPAPAVDPVPAEGTVARRVYEAITTDVALAPIVRGPGDLALRLAALCEGTSVDPAAEVIAAGAWQIREQRWTDGAAGLLRWVKSSADKAKAKPAPVIGTLTRPVAKGPLKSAEPGQFKHVDIDWSDPQPRAGGDR